MLSIKKCIYFLSVILIFACSDMYGQRCQEVYNITMPYSLYGSYFNEHPETHSIYLKIKSGDITYVSFTNEADSLQQSKYIEYYPEFEGDRFLLDKDFPELKINIDQLPSLNLNIYPLNKERSVHYETSINVFRDSFVYRISKPCCFEDASDYNFEFDPVEFSAGYNGNIDSLAKMIQGNFVKQKIIPSPSDSVVLFLGTVDQNGILSGIKLYKSTRNGYTDFLHHELEKNNTSWAPLMQGGSIRKSRIRIFIGLQGNAITISTRRNAYRKRRMLERTHNQMKHN